MKKTTNLLVITIVLTMTITILFNVNAMAKTIPEEDFGIDLLPVGSDSMDWTLEDIQTENDITFSSFAGKIVLMDFFTASEGVCESLANELADVRAAFSSSKLVMISVNNNPASDELSDIQDYIAAWDVTWYVVLDAIPDSVSLTEYYDFSQYPCFYVFDTDLKVAFSNEVLTESEYIISEINEIIDSSTSTTPTGTGTISEFWAKNWYWFVIGGVFLIIAVALTIQRVRIVNHNKKVRQQRLEDRQKKHRQRNR